MDKANALRQATLERRTAEDDITSPWMPVTPRRPIPFPSETSMEEVQYATLSTGNTSPGSVPTAPRTKNIHNIATLELLPAANDRLVISAAGKLSKICFLGPG
ncbi:hypothetical protein FOC4_g10009679 [Fusarium odoratissimum]|uniref:Uncharacterized protein n=1 Tax=Fusarium oxysporum f. sp. cubense (strain race 4) TaxID=2502994 RepID=N1S0M6_FUSC4|nr:hypothetical protein FOC4_g10009679 [Fusarium odoratissimum]